MNNFLIVMRISNNFTSFFYPKPIGKIHAQNLIRLYNNLQVSFLKLEILKLQF
ncbi:hypothetical protein C1645_774429 [Glomus cerebriforme]|uniref:Uncharacterized protein n=1 Tax=Glomus cerebriforme TaxID=658196 RepID=A0A397SSI4_9GLOM|nr:hypothetical protein C1645_774429 [Glomus cerebriforme]